ncbi:MAG: UPF0149 family protein [Thiotrichales bacterium]
MKSDSFEPSDFRALEDALNATDAVLSPAEVHGMLIGNLIRFNHVDVAEFAQTIVGQTDPGNRAQAEALTVLDRVYRISHAQLGGGDLELRLLLPDDDQTLELRVAAACDWARGLLYGMAEQGTATRKLMDRESREFLADCRNISNTEFATEETEADEQVYFELIEFLRLGAMMLRDALQPPATPLSSL